MAIAVLRIPRPAGLGEFRIVHELGTGMSDYVITVSGGATDVREALESLFEELFVAMVAHPEDTEGDRE